MQRAFSMRLGITFKSQCPICILDFEDGDNVAKLACHEKHMLHSDCYTSMEKAFSSKNKDVLCPLCRKPIRKEEVELKKLKLDNEMKDPFALDKDALPLPQV